MGKNRKSKSRQAAKEKVEAPWARNLRKNELGAVIFGCKNYTFKECLDNHIFGLPAAHISYVKNVTPGLKLFLFNYSDRKLHGIFNATTHGGMNIRPLAWITSEGAASTPYAAQVQFDVHRKCRPLLEEEFKPIIADNYYEERLFWFELDKEQAGRLSELFLASPFPEKIPRPEITANWNCMIDALPGSKLDGANNVLKSEDYSGMTDRRPEENQEHSYASALVGSSTDAPGNKWTELFKTHPSSSAVKNGKGVDSREVNIYKSKAERTNLEFEFSKLQVSSKRLPEASPGTVNAECDPIIPVSWEELADENNYEKQTYRNEVTCIQDHGRDSDASDTTSVSSPKDRTFLLVKEAGEASIDIESKETHLHAFVHEENSQAGEPNLINRENNCPMFAGVHMDEQSSSFESVVLKLMLEIEGLKVSNMKQRVKIDSLEHELVNSKLVIDQLQKRCNNELECMPFSNRDDCEPFNFVMEEAVFIVGGFDGSSWLSAFNSYSPSKDYVTSLCPLTFSRSHASFAKLNGELYLYGGIHDGISYDTVESYCPMSNWWFNRPSLNQKRGSLAGASMYEKLYAVGGGDRSQCFSEVELLDLNIGRWIFTQPMLEKRVALAAADMNAALYVAGGYDGRNYLSSVERFDPRQHGWTSIKSMRTKRSCHSLVALNEKLYAFGGYDGDKMVSSVEVFDPRRDFWTPEEPMTVPRRNFGSFVFQGKIYAIGGMNGNKVLDVVECYEEGYGWHMSGPSALGKRCFFSSLIL